MKERYGHLDKKDAFNLGKSQGMTLAYSVKREKKRRKEEAKQRKLNKKKRL